MRARIWLTSVFAAVDLAAQFARQPAPVRQVLLGTTALAGHRLQFHLPLRHGLGKLLARNVQPLDLGRRHRLFAGRPRRLAVDPGQVLVDLRELVLQRGRLAQQPQNHLPPALDGALALANFDLQSLALLVDLRHALARLRDLRFQGFHILLVAANLLIQRVQPHAQVLRVLLVLRDALLDRCRFPLPARPAVRACAPLPPAVPTVAGALR